LLPQRRPHLGGLNVACSVTAPVAVMHEAARLFRAERRMIIDTSGRTSDEILGCLVHAHILQVESVAC
jgi:hypothetical protein